MVSFKKVCTEYHQGILLLCVLLCKRKGKAAAIIDSKVLVRRIYSGSSAARISKEMHFQFSIYWAGHYWTLYKTDNKR